MFYNNHWKIKIKISIEQNEKTCTTCNMKQYKRQVRKNRYRSSRDSGAFCPLSKWANSIWTRNFGFAAPELNRHSIIFFCHLSKHFSCVKSFKWIFFFFESIMLIFLNFNFYHKNDVLHPENTEKLCGCLKYWVSQT